MTPTPEFSKVVRDALSHLYDAAHLQGHALVQTLVPDPPPDAVSGAQALRRVLLDTIETLRPEGQIPYTAREWRPYRVLFSRYVQRQGTPAILLDLAISERQYQREHSRALDAVTDLLWQRAQHVVHPDSSPADDATRAIQHLISGAQREALDCKELVSGTLDAIERLAESHRITIRFAPAADLPMIYGDRGLLRQVILGILSHLLALHEDSILRATVRREGDQVQFSFEMSGGGAEETPSNNGKLSRKLALSQRIAQAIGGSFAVSEHGVELRLPIERQVLLVVDDNLDVIELFQRYTANSAYRIVGARTAKDAMTLARENRPFLITLDVMMPTHDGWELLQSLKHNPETFDIPVAICSVLDERELAKTLGADDYLTKPVSQASLLQLLARWHKANSGASSLD